MKKLLSLLVFALMSVASFAQWVKPEVPTNGQPLSDGLKCYILNVESGTFYTGATVWHSWSTSSGLAAKGQLSVIKKNGGNWNICRESDDKHTFISKVLGDTREGDFGDANGRWEMHVDGSGASNDAWEILEINGDYRFRIAAEDETYGADGLKLPEGTDWATLFVGHWVGEDAKYPNAVYANVTEAEGGITWRFISEEDYDAYFDKIALYEAAMNLKDAIEKAEAEYPGIDLSAQKAVYNNTESTLEQLQDALAGVKTAIQAYINQKMQENASPTEPYDATGLIVNPSFEEGNTNGWTVKASSDTGAKDNSNATYHCDNADGNYLFNIWDWGYPITQKIANIPNGIYRLKAMVTSSDDCTNVYITGESGNIKLHKAVTLETNPTDSRKQTWLTEGEILVPVTNDTITIGAVGCDPDGVSYIENGKWWYKADNFRLEYLGNKTESWKYFQENSDLGLQPYDPATTVAHKQLVADYNQALDDFTSKTDPADIAYALEGVIVLSDSIKKSIADYEILAAKVKDIQDLIGKVTGQSETFLAWVAYMQNTDPEKATEITTNLNSLIAKNFEGQYVFDTAYTPYVQLNPAAATGCTLTGSEAIAYADKLNNAHVTITLAIKNPGDDCTEMIVNASFKDGFTGWNKTGCTGNVNVGGLESLPSVEVWNGKVEVYQEVPGVPNGLYELNCNAFERPTSGAYSGDGTEPSKVFLYMNDFKTGVMNITTDALLKDDAEPGVNCAPNAEWPEGDKVIRGSEADASWTDIEGLEYWMPNGMAGASLAFKAGRYEQKVYGLVEDGKMKIGLTSNNVTCGWVLWTNFKLTFWGTDATVAFTVLKNATAEAQAWWTIYGDDLYDEAFSELENAVEAGNNATADMTGEQLLAILKDIYAALDHAEAALALVNELKEVADQLSTTYENFSETASPEAVEWAGELIAQAEDYLGLTGEQIKQLIADMKDCIEDLKMFDVSEATDEEPMDVTAAIVNPDFEEGNSNGWTIDKKTTQNVQKLTTSWGGTSWEFWASAATNLAFDIQQTIKLAEATYTLSANIVNSYNGQEPAKDEEGNENSGRIYLYVGIICDGDTTLINDLPVVPTTENCGDHYDTYHVTFKVPAPAAKVIVGARTVGTLSARWAAIDDFKLECYGTQSSKETSEGKEVIIEGVDATPTVVAPTAIFTLSGARTNTLVKGINIVRMADGSVKKILK